MNEVVTGDADARLRERMDEEIYAFNAAVTGHHDGRSLSVAVRGDDGEPRAGLYGWTWAGAAPSNCSGCEMTSAVPAWGARMLVAAEAEIRRRGCDQVVLSTHSFQAPGFYARFGYQECGRTPGYPRGHDEIHLLKLFRDHRR